MKNGKEPVWKRARQWPLRWWFVIHWGGSELCPYCYIGPLLITWEWPSFDEHRLPIHNVGFAFMPD